MRLIDADALAKEWKGSFYEGTVESLLDTAPTIEPQRTGKWIVYYECPKCGEITKDFTEYCPFCGADMREVKHMRLIDADATIKEIKARNPDDVSYEDAWAITCIEHAPTIEPERKKGKWIPSFNGRFTGGAYWFHCSKCERIVPDVRNGGWYFCPNCGARMEEGEAE